MKLNEITHLEEGAIPAHLQLILLEIVKLGKCTNMVHYLALNQVTQMFKYGATQNTRFVNEFPSSADQISEVKDLTDAQQVQLALWSLQHLENSAPENIICDESELSEWIKLVCKAQD